ncbi:hypothetical protein FJZ19_01165 [Candidatus Pacearchaeota archaeon]|nr:hypothetical protein [Candidatus Pacearchaeota archaeon]
MEKYQESLETAARAIQIADHMAYITFPLVKEKRLLLKILSELNSSLISIINAILQYEYSQKRIQLYKDARENFLTFKHLASSYNINPEQMKTIIEIIQLAEKHQKSPFEFVKDDKVVIMANGMKSYTITIEKIKVYIIEAKDLIKKAGSKIKQQL